MRRIMLILLLVFTSVILFGCKTEDRTASKAEIIKPELRLDDNDRQKLDALFNLNKIGEITRVSISKSGVSPVIVNDDEVSDSFISIISNAVKEEGIVNMTNPEFRLDVFDKNEKKQSFYLWVGKTGQKSTLMKTEDANTIYTVSEEMTNKLNNLIGYYLTKTSN